MTIGVLLSLCVNKRIVAPCWLSTISYHRGIIMKYPTHARGLTVKEAAETKLTSISFIRDAAHISFRMCTYSREIKKTELKGPQSHLNPYAYHIRRAWYNGS